MYEKIFAFTESWERGLVDHPSDPGGITKDGICLRYAKEKGTVYMDLDRDGDVDGDDIRLVTRSTVHDLFKMDFWAPAKLDLIPPPLAAVAFDAAVNHGARQGYKFLQRALGVTDDGIVGEKTRKAANTTPLPIRTAQVAIDKRNEFYDNLVRKKPSMMVFLKGWKNRTAALRQFIKTL